MRNGVLSVRLGPMRWRLDYSPRDPFSPDDRAWSLVMGPFELSYRSTLDKLVNDDIGNCNAVLAGAAPSLDQPALDDVLAKFRRAGIAP